MELLLVRHGIAESRDASEWPDDRGRPLTSESVMIGMPMAPNATGAVSATRAIATALNGLKPIAMSMTAQIAIGEPPPASASISAPKVNAMTMAWIRWSLETELNDRPSTSKCPVSRVML